MGDTYNPELIIQVLFREKQQEVHVHVRLHIYYNEIDVQ